MLFPAVLMNLPNSEVCLIGEWSIWHTFFFKVLNRFLCSIDSLGVDSIPLPFVVKLIKLAFSYEQWDVLEVLLQPFITLLKTQAQVVQTPAYIMSLQLLAAMEPFFNTAGRKHQKRAATNENASNENSHGTSELVGFVCIEMLVNYGSMFTHLLLSHSPQKPTRKLAARTFIL